MASRAAVVGTIVVEALRMAHGAGRDALVRRCPAGCGSWTYVGRPCGTCEAREARREAVE
jgi:hypothetical protein